MVGNKQSKKYFILSLSFLLLFAVLIIILKTVDVAAVGPMQSEIGLSHINVGFKELVGTDRTFYDMTEYLGIVAILAAVFFAFFGVYRLIKCKKLKLVDKDLYLLASVYVIVAIVYIFFEKCIVNYRPVTVGGALEASFPSSHTMLAVTVMLTTAEQALRRIKNHRLALMASIACCVAAAVTAVFRALSGVHWLTDIIGGVLISLAIFFAYLGFCKRI